jgi:hypothetical protein
MQIKFNCLATSLKHKKYKTVKILIKTGNNRRHKKITHQNESNNET